MLFTSLLFSLIPAGAGAMQTPSQCVERSNLAPLVLDMLYKEQALLGEILNGCNYADVVRLQRTCKGMDSLMKRSKVFDLSDINQKELLEAVQSDNLDKTKKILGLSPKRLSKPLSIPSHDGFSSDLDVVTHAFFHGSADLYKLLVERLGILNFELYKAQFENLSSVGSELEKFKTLEMQSVVLPFSPQNVSWFMNFSSPALFDYLLEHGYVRRIMLSMDPRDVVKLASTMNTKRHTKLVRLNSRPSQSA